MVRDSRRAWPGQLGEAEGLWVLPVFSSCTPQKRVKGSRARPAHGKDGQAHGEVPPPAVVPQGPPAEHAFPPTGGSPPVLVTTSGRFLPSRPESSEAGPASTATAAQAARRRAAMRAPEGITRRARSCLALRRDPPAYEPRLPPL